MIKTTAPTDQRQIDQTNSRSDGRSQLLGFGIVLLVFVIIGLGIVLALAFGQYSETANYNYISPYSHDVLHGIVLSILCIAFLSKVGWKQNESGSHAQQDFFRSWNGCNRVNQPVYLIGKEPLQDTSSE